MKACYLLLLAAVTVGASPAIWAKSRWYQVEVIVFRHTDFGAVGTEQWPALESLPDFRNAVKLFADLPDFSDEPQDNRPNEGSIPGRLAFQSLRRDELQLSGVFRRLRDLSTYEPVLHVGWRQPGLSASRARSVYISDKPAASTDAVMNSTAVRSGSEVIARRVEGTIRVRAGHLLHVDADFVSYGGESPVRITEQRKVKLRELHYFDHPLFGVIVRVTPYRTPVASGQPDDIQDTESAEEQ